MREGAHILDSNCLLDIADGNEKAFRRFFDAFKNKIYSFSFSFTHSSQIAEEITQDVFIKAWAHRESLPDIQNIDAWLSTITRNLCFNYLKKLALEKQAAVTLVKTQPHADDNVEQYLSFKDRVTELQEALEQLSPQQRLIFTLNRDKGLKNEEIAHQLNLSPNTVKTHMVTALRKIRTFLESHAAHLFTLAFIILKNI